jgi:adenosylhomocysteine nucleosidase
MPHKLVAVVAAMRIELAPLLGEVKPRQVNGVALFELAQAVVAVGGIGERCARRAAEVAIDYAQPSLLLSAGIAGAISPKLKVGDVGPIREVVDVATGNRYPTRGGDWVLATSQDVSDADEKQGLLTKYGADVVDMEGAAVAQIAKERGLEFAAVKSISDDAGFAMPPLMRFIDKNGKFANGRFLLYLVSRPKWWPVMRKIRANTAVASANLCREVKHLIGEYSMSPREENVPLVWVPGKSECR